MTVEYKMLENDKFEINAREEVNLERLKQRIVNMAAQKNNFEMQIEQMEEQLAELPKLIEHYRKNLNLAQGDIDKAFNFLKKSHKEQVVEELKKQIEEGKAQLQASIKQQQEQQLQQMQMQR